LSLSATILFVSRLGLPRGLSRGPAAFDLLGLWVSFPPAALYIIR